MTIFSGTGEQAAVNPLRLPAPGSRTPATLSTGCTRSPVASAPVTGAGLALDTWDVQTEPGQPLSPRPGRAAPTEGSLGLRQSLFVGGIDDVDDAVALGIVLGEAGKRGLSPGHLATQGRPPAARPSWVLPEDGEAGRSAGVPQTLQGGRADLGRGRPLPSPLPGRA